MHLREGREVTVLGSEPDELGKKRKGLIGGAHSYSTC